MDTGRPRATATDRSRVKSVHQMRFQSRLSALLSCEPSMLLFVSSLRPNTSSPVPTSCACPSLEQRSLQLYSSRKRFWSHLAQRQSRPLEDFQAHSGAYLMKLSVTFSIRHYSYFQAARRTSMACYCKASRMQHEKRFGSPKHRFSTTANQNELVQSKRKEVRTFWALPPPRKQDQCLHNCNSVVLVVCIVQGFCTFVESHCCGRRGAVSVH